MATAVPVLLSESNTRRRSGQMFPVPVRPGAALASWLCSLLGRSKIGLPSKGTIVRVETQIGVGATYMPLLSLSCSLMRPVTTH